MERCFGADSDLRVRETIPRALTREVRASVFISMINSEGTKNLSKKRTAFGFDRGQQKCKP
jgi:hypothetical protein